MPRQPFGTEAVTEMYVKYHAGAKKAGSVGADTVARDASAFGSIQRRLTHLDATITLDYIAVLRVTPCTFATSPEIHQEC